MRSAVCLFAAALAASSVAADVVTLTDGTPISGTVVSMDAETVVVESDIGRQELRREAVGSIELGNVLVTGIVDRTFTSKAYRGRFTPPAGWTMHREPGLDFAARSGEWVAIGRSLPLEGMQDGGESMIGGAIAGLTSSMPGAEAAEPRSGSWAGQRMSRRPRSTSPCSSCTCPTTW